MKHQATPYLTFNGNAKEALDYYKELFGGEITNVQTYGQADFPTPPEADEMILHARFKQGPLFFMASDATSDRAVTIGSNITLALELESEEEIQTIYSKLSEKGTVHMELQDTFWGAKYAKVTDPFGVTWDLNFEKGNG
ncbi:VOC family protein [Bacillus sp. FJAT-42376]|uniref:VOC family protein n=1 Tax=Bacillus sp. FJAT-42376 TaxID=2014076 RepID=UPI000F500F01|nr:VOC family protein [Bacillus sp. FJAT-42376]AZB44523.1 VOC family protein [Bacillus sp. FJAT-42376]